MELLGRRLAPPMRCAGPGAPASRTPACAFPNVGHVLRARPSRPLSCEDAFSCQKVFLVMKELLALQSQEYWVLWPRSVSVQALLVTGGPLVTTHGLHPTVLPENKAVSSAPSSGCSPSCHPPARQAAAQAAQATPVSA